MLVGSVSPAQGFPHGDDDGDVEVDDDDDDAAGAPRRPGQRQAADTKANANTGRSSPDESIMSEL